MPNNTIQRYEEERMIRLTYFSTSTRKLSESEKEELLQVCLRKNAIRKITGVLYLSDIIYLQTLEGAESLIFKLMDELRRDERHTKITVTTVEEIKERLYPTWSMKLVTTSPDVTMIMSQLLQQVAASYEIIRCYTQPTVLKYLESGINPNGMHPRNVEKVILFSDIVSYTTISEVLNDPEQILQFINLFLIRGCDIISRHGGELTKFIGDCIFAAFDTNQVMDAVRAAIALKQSAEDIRRNAAPNSPQKVLYCGIALAVGHVIEGNVGSASKMDYTYIGNPVNIAARLEHATREYKIPILVTEDVKKLAEVQGNMEFSYVGKISLRNIDDITAYAIPQYYKDYEFQHAYENIQKWKKEHEMNHT